VDAQAAETAHAVAARPVSPSAVAAAYEASNAVAPAVEAASFSETAHAASDGVAATAFILQQAAEEQR